MEKNYDFSGWATKANLLCSDGRVIMKDAFKHCDGLTVPLIWNHDHTRPDVVLGKALLENREDGVYAYGYFNDTEAAQNAKLCVQHGDINQLSIYANKLKQMGSNVIHGMIREVSLVHCGANPGARIESVIMHGEDSEEEAIIRCGEFIIPTEELFHADKDEEGETEVVEENKKPKSEETLADVFDTLSEKQKNAVYVMMAQLVENAKNESKDEVKHSDDESEKEEPEKEIKEESKEESEEESTEESKEESEEEEVKHSDEAEVEADDDEKTVEDVFNSLNEKQKKVVYAMLGTLLEDEEEADKDNKGGNDDMKHNIFENETNAQDVLTHADMQEIFADAKRVGSLKEAVLQHGIEDIEMLFPEAKSLNNPPAFIKRDDTWVADVMRAVHHTPFSRIKSVFADITEADARAKGYVKGNLKVEEVFSLLKRVTTPTTVYKKQKLDRDDVIDITDFDVIAWLKSEMRMMLEEEIARAILVGDGRSASSNDKINEQNIRPIWTDDDVYTVKATINVAADASDDVKAKAFIKACIKSRKNYKGSGNPTMFISEDMLTNCLLLEDMNGRVIYDTIDKLKTALRVSKIVPVPVMENLTRVVGANTHELAGIYVNMADYNVGADKGGAVSMFDDFDLDYNQMKYLIETRCSGALTVPFSAVAVEFVSATPVAGE